jgi:hypothetical protein
MRINWFSILFFITLGTGMVLCQDCPKWGDKKGALQFLLANKAHGTEADPTCVNKSFATLSRDDTYTEALVGLLDFKRSTQDDDFITTEKIYPATDSLFHIGKPATPYLIKAIRENDSELVRKNAAYILGGIYASCTRGVLALLESEANKQGTTAEQTQRLVAARDHIKNFYSQCAEERNSN